MKPRRGEYIRRASDTVSLREYVDIRLLSIENAIVLAKQNMDSRLDSMNEIREQLRDQASRFVTRAEALSLVVAMTGVLALLLGALVWIKS